MKIHMSCMTCLQIHGAPPTDALTALPVQDTPYYRMTCPEGHETLFCLQQMKFEVLFDLGLHALADGYPRECVVSIASALEEFQRLFVEFHCLRSGIATETLDLAWRKVSAQSERQLGAYMFVHLLAARSCAPILEQEFVTLRNAVVHKGKIPSEGEATAFSDHVAKLILGLLHDMRTSYPVEAREIMTRHVTNVHRAASQAPNGSIGISTFISFLGREPQPTLVDYLNGLKVKQRMFARA